MDERKDENGELLPDYQRLTRVGKFLRKDKFRRIATAFQCFKGEMSFVYSRPLLIEYLKLYNSEQKKARCFAWYYRMGSNQWSKCHFLGRKISL